MTQDQHSELRRLPSNLDAERAVLGSILLDNTVLPTVQAAVTDDDFYDTGHRAIYRACLKLADANTSIDPTTLADALDRAGQLEHAGGHAYSFRLEAAVLSTANVEAHCRVVRDRALARTLLRALAEAASTIYTEGSHDEALPTLEAVIEAVNKRVSAADGPRHIRDVSLDVITRLDELRQSGAEMTGLPTHYPDIDRYTGGLHPGEIYVIAASPGLGKTSLASCLTENIAVKSGGTILFFSAEMSAEQLAKRQIAVHGKLDLSMMDKPRFLTHDEMTSYANAAKEIGSAEIYIDDTPAIDGYDLRARARHFAAVNGRLDLIVVDYLQLLSLRGARGDNRNAEVTRISSLIKQTARECEVPVILLSQLSRDGRKQKREPELHDLRDSGAIEQDAYFVGFLHPNPDADLVYQERIRSLDILFLIKKHRGGPTGRFSLFFKGHETKFYSAEY